VLITPPAGGVSRNWAGLDPVTAPSAWVCGGLSGGKLLKLDGVLALRSLSAVVETVHQPCMFWAMSTSQNAPHAALFATSWGNDMELRNEANSRLPALAIKPTVTLRWSYHHTPCRRQPKNSEQHSDLKCLNARCACLLQLLARLVSI